MDEFFQAIGMIAVMAGILGLIGWLMFATIFLWRQDRECSEAHSRRFDQEMKQRAEIDRLFREVRELKIELEKIKPAPFPNSP